MGRRIINNVATGQRNVDQFIDNKTVGVRKEISLTFSTYWFFIRMNPKRIGLPSGISRDS